MSQLWPSPFPTVGEPSVLSHEKKTNSTTLSLLLLLLKVFCLLLFYFFFSRERGGDGEQWGWGGMGSRGETTQHKKRQRTLPLAGNKNRPGERRGKLNPQWVGVSSEGDGGEKRKIFSSISTHPVPDPVPANPFPSYFAGEPGEGTAQQ